MNLQTRTNKTKPYTSLIGAKPTWLVESIVARAFVHFLWESAFRAHLVGLRVREDFAIDFAILPCGKFNHRGGDFRVGISFFLQVRTESVEFCCFHDETHAGDGDAVNTKHPNSNLRPTVLLKRCDDPRYR